jgi:hypothetical protein
MRFSKTLVKNLLHFLRGLQNQITVRILGLQPKPLLHPEAKSLPVSHYFQSKSHFFRLQQFASNFLVRSGWYNSFLTLRSVDQSGKPLPWLTYPAIYFIELLDLSNKVVMEFGSGASTLYFSRRSKSVISYETSKYWHNLFEEKLGPNCLMHFVSKDFMEELLSHESSNKLNDLFVHDCLHNFEPECGTNSTSVYDIILNL